MANLEDLKNNLINTIKVYREKVDQYINIKNNLTSSSELNEFVKLDDLGKEISSIRSDLYHELETLMKYEEKHDVMNIAHAFIYSEEVKTVDELIKLHKTNLAKAIQGEFDKKLEDKQAYINNLKEKLAKEEKHYDMLLKLSKHVTKFLKNTDKYSK